MTALADAVYAFLTHALKPENLAMATADLDLENCSAPDDVAPVLRRAAEKYRESRLELQSAWQDKNAGRGWEIIARELEKLATKLERTDLI
jgi:hypothetical protein